MIHPKTLLSIAGTSPISGAGVTADVQVFRDFGFHGVWVPTALVDQDTTAIRAVHPVDPGWITRAIRNATASARPVGVKIGMVHNEAVLGAVVDALEPLVGKVPIVSDPVLASGWGTPLHEQALADKICDRLLSMVTVITPNVPEAEQLSGRTITDLAEAEAAAQTLIECGANAVLLKGGHLAGAPGDVLARRKAGSVVLTNDVQFAADVHGTGCHLSSAIAALLALGFSLDEAVRRARRYLVACVSVARPLLGGGRPLIVHGTETAAAALRLVK